MKTTAIEVSKIDELVAALDRDIQHIEGTLLQLNELRSLVIKRNDDALGKLLGEIQAETGSYKKHELERQSIREELAGVLGCKLEEMTLSTLETVLPEEQKAQVAERKTKLRSLIVELKKEHLSTALLLSECTRFNRLLLKGIFDLGRGETAYYGSDGSTKRQSDTAFVNLKL